MRAARLLFPGRLILAFGFVFELAACGDSETAGAEAARRRAAEEQVAKGEGPATPARRLSTPVPVDIHVPCTQLIDPASFQTALGERQPLTVKDVTPTAREATASCSLVRGGKRPTEAEQNALIKRTGKLGVLPGDEVCNVTAFCWTIEDRARLQARCKDRKDQDDESLGSFACVHIVAVGAADVKVFQLFDDDTRCILQIRGGPSNVSNDQIQSCAKTARDTIGPAQIKVTAARAGSAG
jgi:hypothetical protein